MNRRNPADLALPTIEPPFFYRVSSNSWGYVEVEIREPAPRFGSRPVRGASSTVHLADFNHDAVATVEFAAVKAYERFREGTAVREALRGKPTIFDLHGDYGRSS